MRDQEIGLVIADSVMPEMDGFELLEVMGIDPKMQNTYAIIIIRPRRTSHGEHYQGAQQWRGRLPFQTYSDGSCSSQSFGIRAFIP